MERATKLVLLVAALVISCSAHPSGGLNSTEMAESEAAKEQKAGSKETVTSSASVTGTNQNSAVKPASVAEEDELKPPTKEGGLENPADNAQADGTGRCGGGGGWYGGLGGLGNGLVGFGNGLGGLTNALGALGNGLGALSNALAGLNNGAGGLNNGAGGFTDGAGRLNNGVGGFNNGAGRLNNGAGRLNNGIGRWYGGGGLGFYPFLG